jgi:alkylation response protein AidB-like acyl-CoA dehydrogenase
MCGAASEPGGSSLLLSSISPSSYVEKVDGGYRMYGKKQFATNFESAEYAMVMFQIKENPDPTAAIFVIVEPGQDGITVEDTWDTLGMRATRSNSVSFDGAFVPESRVLMQGNNMFQRVFEEASANFYHTFSLVYLGLLVGLVSFAEEYLKQRIPRGYTQPMAYHPSSLQTIGSLVDRVDQARLITRQVSMTYDTYGNVPEAFFGFSKAKLAVSNALMEAATRLPSACGANSLYNKTQLPRMIRDAFVGTVMPPHMYFEREFVAVGEMGLNPMEIQSPLKLANP